jgi:hypothetical protein
MFTRFTASLAGTTLTAAALGLAIFGFAGTANAASVDDQFIAQLKADGITTNNPAKAVSLAHNVCSSLDEGHSSKEVIDSVADSTGMSAKGAKIFAVDAASAYCPQYVTSS